MNIMKRAAVLLCAVACAATLAGCAPHPEPPRITETQYVAFMRDNVPEVANATPAQLDSLASGTCGLVKEGGAKDDAGWLLAIKAATEGGLSARDAGAAVAYEVARGCPQLTSYLPAS